MSKIDYQKYLGAPFKYRGQSIAEGFDCYNLCRAIYKEKGVELPEYAYSDKPEDSLIHKLINEGEELLRKIDKPEPYCLVLLKIFPPYPTHLGVVLEDCIHFIHIMQKRSVAVERFDSPLWKDNITGFYRYIGENNA